MIKLSNFIESKQKRAKHHLFSPDVPEFWGGYYAVFKPKDGSKFWIKKYYSNNKSKSFKTAHLTIEIVEAHKHWNDWLNGGNPLRELDYLG